MMNVKTEIDVVNLLERIAKAMELIAASLAMYVADQECKRPGWERQTGELFDFTFHEVYGKD